VDSTGFSLTSTPSTSFHLLTSHSLRVRLRGVSLKVSTISGNLSTLPYEDSARACLAFSGSKPQRVSPSWYPGYPGGIQVRVGEPSPWSTSLTQPSRSSAYANASRTLGSVNGSFFWWNITAKVH